MSLFPLSSLDAVGTTAPDSVTVFLDLDSVSLGPPVPEVIRAVKHLCGLFRPEENFNPIRPDQYEDAAFEYYEEIHRRYGRVEGLKLVSFVSTYYHEIRHGHDLLVTAVGQDVLSEAVNVGVNAVSLLRGLIGSLAEEPNRRFYLPISNDPELSRILPGAEAVLRHFSKRQAEANLFGRPQGLPLPISVVQLLESSALSIQIAFIRAVFGEDAVLELYHFISTHPSADKYLAALAQVTELSRATLRGELDTPVVNYLMWRALLGAAPVRGRLGDGPHPAILYQFIQSQTLFKCQATSSLRELGQQIDGALSGWQLQGTADTITVREVELRKRVAKFQELWESIGGAEDSEMFCAYEHVVNASIAMMTQVAELPEMYCDPVNYLGSYLAQVWPAIPMKVKEGGILYDYMTRGQKVVDYKDWSAISSGTGVFNLLAKGRGACGLGAWEDLCWQLIVDAPGNGKKLRFQDDSGLFE